MSNQLIEHRAVKNTAVGVISFFVTMCQTIVAVPILLKYWGNDTYGLWLILMAGFSLLQTLDLGHQSYIGCKLNVQYHTNPQLSRCTLGSSLLIAYFLGMVEMVVCVLLIASNKISLLLSVSPQVISENKLSFGLLILMVMWLVIGSASGIIVRVMIPGGMLYESLWFGIALRFAQFLSIIIVAVAGGNLLAACLSYSIIQTIITMLALVYITKKLPQFYPWWHMAQWREGFRGLQKSLVLTLISIGQQLTNNGLVIAISMLFTAAMIPAFTTLRTLTNTAGTVTSIFIMALAPDMIRYHAIRETDKLDSIFNTNWFISGICVNFGIILVLPVIEPIYKFWTKGLLAFNPTLFLLLTVAISLTNFGAGLTMYLQGINDLRSQTFMTMIRTGVLFLVIFGFSSYCGILSVGIGCVVAELFASVVLPVFFVSKQLSILSSTLSFRHVALAIVPPILFLLVGSCVMMNKLNLGVITLVLLPLLCAVYCVNWKILNNDVRVRISALVTSFVRKVTFGY
jgi:O-antigen/teichoic acid export membrane protein